MGFERPSLKSLIDRSIGEVSGRTKGSAFIKKGVERVLAQVVAALSHGLHGHLEYLEKQFFPTTGDISSLLGWGAWLKIPRKGTVQAVGTATFPATNWTVLPALTEMQTPDGLYFQTTADATAAFGEVSAPVVAVIAGSAANLDAGTPVTLAGPVAGVDSNGTLSAGTSGGSDLEDPEDYRPRILNGLRLPPAGGGPGDYVAWALEVPGVTRAWEVGNQMGYGTVSVAFVMDDRDSIIPLLADLSAVQANIDAKRPLDVRAVYVQAPIPAVVDIAIALRPNTQAVREAVLLSLESLFLTESTLATALPVSHVTEAISTSQGEQDHSITSISPLDPGPWGLLVLGTVSFTTL